MDNSRNDPRLTQPDYTEALDAAIKGAGEWVGRHEKQVKEEAWATNVLLGELANMLASDNENVRANAKLKADHLVNQVIDLRDKIREIDHDRSVVRMLKYNKRTAELKAEEIRNKASKPIS